MREKTSGEEGRVGEESYKSTGTNSFSTAVSCFHLTFPAVSALIGCEGRCVCQRCGGVLDIIPLVLNQVN